ncbi:MAG: hypothetical protein WC003_14395 [Terrimicrobiaceae bacterium]
MPKPPTKPGANGAPAPSATPSVLGSDKQTVDALLGRPVMTRGLLGMTAQGEKAYAYPQAGDEIVVGFFDGIARYLAAIRTKGPKTGYSPAEMSSILALNGAPDLWKSEQPEAGAPNAGKPSKTAKKTASAQLPATYFSLSDKDRHILGWQPGNKPFAFFLLPSHPNQPHILLNEWQVERAIG